MSPHNSTFHPKIDNLSPKPASTLHNFLWNDVDHENAVLQAVLALSTNGCAQLRGYVYNAVDNLNSSIAFPFIFTNKL